MDSSQIQGGGLLARKRGGVAFLRGVIPQCTLFTDTTLNTPYTQKKERKAC